MRTALVIFLGGFGRSSAELLVDRARLNATLDTVASWNAARDDGSPAVLVTDDPAILAGADAPGGSIVDADPGPFHFGRRLAGAIRRHNLDAVLYMGGGSLPFLGAPDLQSIAVRAAPGVVVTNNAFSSDMIAFRVSETALASVETCERDNSLTRVLQEQAGYAVEPLPRSLATQFDIDAPSDVAVMALAAGHPGVASAPGPRLASYVGSLDVDLNRYRAVLPFFLDPSKQILVAGRVGSHSWAYLERETACRVRLFAEERGLEADGRAEAGTARSFLGYHLDAAGLGRFFETLAELCNAALIDSRVLFAHKRITASREDRFLSDLGQPDAITDPFLRDFTRAALAAPVPVLLGGHSLVSGGLMALNELAWALRDAGRL
jgi:hypothetical protein